MILSVVVPVFNRRENLAVCLMALSKQVSPPEFEVIVVDDGSTDGVKDWLYKQYESVDAHAYDSALSDDTNQRWMPTDGTQRGGWKVGTGGVPLTYLSGGPNKGFRGGRARNIGAFNARGDRFVFIDSDVAVNQHLLHHYAVAAEAQPNAVIVGRYYYLPPIKLSNHPEVLWESGSVDELKGKLDALGLDYDHAEGDHALRYWIELGGRPDRDFTTDTNWLGKGAGLGGLSGNISYPRGMFESVGGFDEKMVGHGGEDAMLGLTVDDKANADWLFYAPLFGFHQWHGRDQKRNQREVDANIEYIDRTFGIGRYKNAKKWSDSMDKSNPGHYHHHQGAVAAKTPDDGTVWLLRSDHMTRIGVTTQQWLNRMGFIPLDVKTITQDELAKYEAVGVTREVGGWEDLKVESTDV